MKKTKKILCLTLITALVWSCGGTSSSKKNASSETQTEEEVEIKESASSSVFGTYTLTDMVTVKGDLEPTEQDLEYIKQSKERTLERTMLTLNEDGTFERVFPHPSGDGSTKTWNGKYEMTDEKLVLNVNMNGKIRPVEFDILEQSPNKLSIVTGFGKLKMNYTYSK